MGQVNCESTATCSSNSSDVDGTGTRRPDLGGLARDLAPVISDEGARHA